MSYSWFGRIDFSLRGLILNALPRSVNPECLSEGAEEHGILMIACFGSAKCDLLTISTSASRISTGRRGSRTVGITKNYGEHCPEYLVMIETTPFRPRTWRLTIFSRLLRRKLRMSVSPHHRPRILVLTPTAVPVNYWNSNRWTLTSSFSSSKLHRTKAVPWILCRRG